MLAGWGLGKSRYRASEAGVVTAQPWDRVDGLEVQSQFWGGIPLCSSHAGSLALPEASG